MNRFDMSGMKLAEMRKHLDLAKQNVGNFLLVADMDRQWRIAIEGADLVWALWPDQGPGTRLGYGLAMLKGYWYLAAHREAGVAAECSVVRLMFPSFEVASRMCALHGDDSSFEHAKAS